MSCYYDSRACHDIWMAYMTIAHGKQGSEQLPVDLLILLFMLMNIKVPNAVTKAQNKHTIGVHNILSCLFKHQLMAFI